MSNLVETVPSQHIGAKECVRIANEFLVNGGPYQIQEVINENSDPAVVSGLELRGKLEPDKTFLVTDLETGNRYYISSGTDGGVVGFEQFTVSCLKADIPVSGLLNRLIDDNEARLIHWHIPAEGKSELDIEGQLDPLLHSIAGRLREIS